MHLSSYRILLCSVILFLSASDIHAQGLRPRVGFGLGLVSGTTEQAIGISLDSRLSVVINQDLSIAASANLVNYILKGREEASYFFHPGLSAIVTLNSVNLQSPYLMFGLGGNLPAGGNAESVDSGPSLHGGLGWVFSLQATSLYIEVIPRLVIVRSGVEMQLPARFVVML